MLVHIVDLILEYSNELSDISKANRLKQSKIQHDQNFDSISK